MADRVRNEFVLEVRGTVARRLAGMENAKLATGEIEVQAQLGRDPERGGDAALLHQRARRAGRREPPAEVPLPRHPAPADARAAAAALGARPAIREAHHRAGFVEVETPILLKSTPEGARDFIVPSRLQPGSVYALPQSPQQLKQLLMVAGMDRYFQIARCFRDEDLRGDRQPEFTQLDLEMSFVTEERVMDFVEAMIVEVSRTVVPDRPIQQLPFPRIDYHEALERFGSDKPDLRFGHGARGPGAGAGGGEHGFRVFDEAIAAGGRSRRSRPRAWPMPAARRSTSWSRWSARYGAQGLAHVSVDADGTAHSPIAKFLGDERSRRSSRPPPAGPGDLILIVADADHEVVADVLGRLRQEMGLRLGLADPNVLAYCWVYHFPMYQWDAERTLGRHSQPVQRGLARTTRSFSSPRPAIRTGRRAGIRPVGRGRCSTTSPSTAGSSAAGRFGSTGASCWSAASPCRATRSRRCTTCSAGSWRPSTTARRRTAGSPWASTAGRPSSRPDQHSGGHGLPEDPVRDRPDAGSPFTARSGAVR